jgi:hypothetical protein
LKKGDESKVKKTFQYDVTRKEMLKRDCKRQRNEKIKFFFAVEKKICTYTRKKEREKKNSKKKRNEKLLGK